LVVYWLSLRFFKEKTMIICFEGIDGTGKTTLAKATAENLNFEYIKFPTSWFYDQSKVCNSVYADGHLHLADFYRMTEYLQTNNVVLDRYLPSQMAYVSLTPLGGTHEDLLNAGFVLPIPDITFYLKCPLKLSCERLINSREMLDTEFESIDKLELVKKMYEFNVIPLLQKNNWKIFILDARAPIKNLLDDIGNEVLKIKRL